MKARSERAANDAKSGQSAAQRDQAAIDISITPVWTIRHHGERQFDRLLLTLLQGIQETGRLTDAAQRAGISYRHSWNVIEQWRGFFRRPLVAMARGRGTRLTPLGRKLLWAGQRVHAQLGPQLENLSAELARALNEGTPPLRAHASHDFAVARLRELLAAAGSTTLDLQYRGSVDALASLRRGGCGLAGFHLADGPLGAEIMKTYAKWMNPDRQRLIWFVSRVQGLMIAPGNPKAVAGIADLVRPGLRFVNRQRGSGTRALLERLLAHTGVDRTRVAGFEDEEFTHAAVAALVAGGVADGGFGGAAAAAQFQLGFVPVTTERYFLICRQDVLDHPALREVLALIRSHTFRDVVAALPGYSAIRSGEISTIPEALPWAEFEEYR